MRYLKLFENKNIEEICKEFKIKNWTLNPDGTVDVEGDVNICDKNLYKIPLKFGIVKGNFSCRNNKLTSLEGCPNRIIGNFNCGVNKQLKNLEGCPSYIDGDFFCVDNDNIYNFDGFPRHAKAVILTDTPIQWIFDIFKNVYLEDGGEYFSTSGTMMDFFQDCDPIRDGKIIIKHRMNNFLLSIDKELTQKNINKLTSWGWKII